MKEVDLNKKVADFICTLPESFARKRLAGPNQKGQPDITGCIQGIRIELEGKLDGNKPTPIQKNWLKKWSNAGAYVGVYWTLAGAKKLIAMRFPGVLCHGNRFGEVDPALKPEVGTFLCDIDDIMEL